MGQRALERWRGRCRLPALQFSLLAAALELSLRPAPSSDRAGKTDGIHPQHERLLHLDLSRACLQRAAHMTAQRRLQASPHADADLDESEGLPIQRSELVDRPRDLLVRVPESGKSPNER